jgi:mycothiol S-conjugate amidase
MVDDALRLMAVHAHPDDESSKGGATMARYVAEGAQVMVVTCTGGERGSVLNPRLKDDPAVAAEMTERRRREMAAASAILGIQHRWLGFVDSGLPEGDPLPPVPEDSFSLVPLEEAAERLVKLVREFRPHVMTTYDPNGGYPHPDHIMCHRVSVAAFEAAGDPERHPDAGPAWRPLKLYYDGFRRHRLIAIHEAMKARGLDSPFEEWIDRMNKDPRPERAVTTRIECARYFGIRNDALRAHATQVDPDGWWLSIPLEIEQEACPTEEFELARSLVDTTLPEDDLFAGVRNPVPAAD